MIPIRLPWRPRARPSATLHEIPICSKKSKLGIRYYNRPSGLSRPFYLINLLLTFTKAFAVNIYRMPEQPLHIEDLPGSQEGIRILRLAGPLTLANVFGFQSKVRADTSRALILDFTNVPLADSAGIGALVGAYVTRQKNGRSLGLVGVNPRIPQALEVTRGESFFRFYGTVTEAEQAA